ncbi:ferrochelatase [Gordonia effusa NBRC 100432]|uniref:Coproporphyrin III ferrochelatase n=1 Tax=Gordonia effusa NBRC 100432 TaxID=1077974 RepID=H0QWZ1_9ACTN|nr:ferrochelatase [Gordonia effusa]GAB17342.1 ferrochelatase [Gordonia effusa NBRC 100432]
MSVDFDSILFLSFGGPDKPDDVRPFLENVTRGRGVPPERLDEVAQHYLHFGGVSPINELNLAMIESLRAELASRAIDLPVYFGNRNWHPMVEDTVAQMYDAGHRRVLVFPTSAWGGYSGCAQYHEDIGRALAALGDRAAGMVLRKLPQYWFESLFVDAAADSVRRAAASLSGEFTPRLVFTAHSIPDAADRNSGPSGADWALTGLPASEDGGRLYSGQVLATAQRVAAAASFGDFDQVWQSRSGPPQIPWLEPDIVDHLEAIAAQGVRSVIVSPIGFVSDHLEVVWDLDNEAREKAAELGLEYVRADSVGTDPRFVAMAVDLIENYRSGELPSEVPLGVGDNGTYCAGGKCCQAPARRPNPVRSASSS